MLCGDLLVRRAECICEEMLHGVTSNKLNEIQAASVASTAVIYIYIYILLCWRNEWARGRCGKKIYLSGQKHIAEQCWAGSARPERNNYGEPVRRAAGVTLKNVSARARTAPVAAPISLPAPHSVDMRKHEHIGTSKHEATSASLQSLLMMEGVCVHVQA